MARFATIQINLSESDLHLKKKILELKAHNDPKNPYYDRSESRIAKMLLQNILPREHKKICGSLRKTG